MRLIDADELKLYIEYCQFCHKCHKRTGNCADNCPLPDYLTEDWRRIIDEQPTVDPVKHGVWVLNRFGEYDCSFCKSYIALSEDWHGYPNYCPNCGAKMDEVSE